VGVEGFQSAGKYSLEGLPTSETGLDIVPPFDVVAFIGFPAEKDDAAVPHRWKINQSVVVILQLNPESFKLPRSHGQIKEELRVAFAVGETSASVFGAFRGVPRSSLKSAQSPMRTLNLLHDRPHVSEKRIRFFNCKQLHTMRTILLSRSDGCHFRL